MKFTNQNLRDALKIILLVGWLAAIFFFSSQPGFLSSNNQYELVVRKLGHFSEFAILTFLLYKAFALLKNKPFSHNLSLAVFLAMVYAGVDELHQLSVAGRSGTLRDLTIDLFGIIVAAWLISLEREHQQRYPQQRHLIKI